MSEPVLTIIVPAYNEEAAIEKTLTGLLSLYRDWAEIILVNDGSTDRTAELASSLEGVRVLSHKRNFGYGAALKTGISRARTDLVCFFDSDGQHDPEDVTRLYEALGSADMVVGSRGGSAFKDLRRGPGKMVLHLLANLLSGKKIPDLNSGLRLIRRDILLRYLHLLPDGFSASTTSSMVFMVRNYQVRYIDIRVRARTGKSQVHQLRDGSATLLLITRTLLLFNPMRFFLPFSLIFLILGGGYGLFKLYQVGFGLSPGSLLILFIGIMAFVFGLICDQISALRLERFEDKESIRHRTED